jgi:AraC family transcriptional regulator
MKTRPSIEKAIDFIEEHLDAEDWGLDDVARAAGYSSWHFQRLFGALTGQTLKDYIRTRRLTAAYEALRAGTAPRLLELALASGFESQEAFTRAFKAQFGATPGAVRKGGVARPCHPAALKPRLTPEHLEHLTGGVTMVPDLIELKAMTVAGLATNFVSALAPDTDNMQRIPQLWDDFIGRLAQVPRTTYGLVYQTATAARSDELRYMAGYAVEGGAVPAGFETKAVPAGKYARFVHKGKIANLPLTMRYIMGSWLPKSGYTLRNAPEIEVYTDKFNPTADDSELPILIPVD